MKDPDPRPPTDLEKQIVVRLLAEDFPGRDELRAQTEDLRVRAIDPEGSLRFVPSKLVRAEVNHRVPVEGYGLDTDGMTIHFLLHVVDGLLFELELYRDDSGKILRCPGPDEIEVMSPPFKG